MTRLSLSVNIVENLLGPDMVSRPLVHVTYTPLMHPMTLIATLCRL